MLHEENQWYISALAPIKQSIVGLSFSSTETAAVTSITFYVLTTTSTHFRDGLFGRRVENDFLLTIGLYDSLSFWHIISVTIWVSSKLLDATYMISMFQKDSAIDASWHSFDSCWVSSSSTFLTMKRKELRTKGLQLIALKASKMQHLPSHIPITSLWATSEPISTLKSQHSSSPMNSNERLK